MKITVTQPMIDRWVAAYPMSIGALLLMAVGEYCLFGWTALEIGELTYKLPPAVYDWATILYSDPMPITFTCKLNED